MSAFWTVPLQGAAAGCCLGVLLSFALWSGHVCAAGHATLTAAPSNSPLHQHRQQAKAHSNSSTLKQHPAASPL